MKGSFTKKHLLMGVLGLMLSTASTAQMRITEFMYDGGAGEFIEFTNIGSTSINMSGWSFDDDSDNPGTVSLSDFGIVQPGESVILTESTASTFRTAWSLCNNIKIIGSNGTNLGRSDIIYLYDGSGNMIDQLR